MVFLVFSSLFTYFLPYFSKESPLLTNCGKCGIVYAEIDYDVLLENWLPVLSQS